MKNADAAPYAAAKVTRCHSWMSPLSDSTASPAKQTARTTSAVSITSRRSNRSLITPPTSTSTTCGTVSATPTSDIAIGLFEIS